VGEDRPLIVMIDVGPITHDGPCIICRLLQSSGGIVKVAPRAVTVR
jgi:hypothetical protein